MSRIPDVRTALQDDPVALARAKRIETMEKGDVEGHPFRGNQHTDGGGEGGDEDGGGSVKELTGHATTYDGKADDFRMMADHADQSDDHDKAEQYQEAANLFDRAAEAYHHAAKAGKEGKELRASSLTDRAERLADRAEDHVRRHNLHSKSDQGSLAKKADSGELSKGDTPGHEFRGNQHTGGGSEGGDSKRTAPDAQDSSDIRGLESATGEYGGTFAEDLKRNGFIHLDKDYHKDTKESRAAIDRLKARGWKLEGTDKGVAVMPPWAKADTGLLLKGESEGHPFRGNQHTGGEAGGSDPNPRVSNSKDPLNGNVYYGAKEGAKAADEHAARAGKSLEEKGYVKSGTPKTHITEVSQRDLDDGISGSRQVSQSYKHPSGYRAEVQLNHSHPVANTTTVNVIVFNKEGKWVGPLHGKSNEPEMVKGDKPGHSFYGSQHAPGPSDRSQLHHTVDGEEGSFRVKKTLHLKDHIGDTYMRCLGHCTTIHETRESAQAEASSLNAGLKGR